MVIVTASMKERAVDELTKIGLIPDQTEPDERIGSMLYARCTTMKEFAEMLK